MTRQERKLKMLERGIFLGVLGDRELGLGCEVNLVDNVINLQVVVVAIVFFCDGVPLGYEFPLATLWCFSAIAGPVTSFPAVVAEVIIQAVLPFSWRKSFGLDLFLALNPGSSLLLCGFSIDARIPDRKSVV